MVRRQKLRSQATQVGGSGELAVGADDAAGMVQFELQSQAAKFHAEFEKQARSPRKQPSSFETRPTYARDWRISIDAKWRG